MSLDVIIHLANEDPILAEIEEIPNPTHQSIVITNPRRRDGRALHYITDGATAFVFPWSRISFIEIMEAAEEKEVIKPWRDEE
jgi:hypothetical protein